MTRLLRAADSFGSFMDNRIADRCLVGLFLLAAVLISIAIGVRA